MSGPPGIDALALEQAAFEAWPAEEVLRLGPWRLRFARGVTRRANSVWVGPGRPQQGLPRAIDAVERFYRERSQPARFQLMPFSDPELEPLLAARGYAAEEPVSLQLAECARVAELPNREGARCDAELSDGWFEISGTRGRFHGAQSEVYRALIGRLAGRAGFASACDDAGRIAAVGLVVVAAPLAGVFSMLTLPEARRRGLGEAVLGQLARFARERGARLLYLQVDVGNHAACELYRRSGFLESHRYRYRSRAC